MMTISEHARKCAKEKHMDAAIADAVAPTLRLLKGFNDTNKEIARLKALIGEK